MSNINKTLSTIGMLAICVISLAMTILNLYVTIQGLVNPDMPPRVFGYSSLLASDSSMEGKLEGSFDKGSMILFKSSDGELQVGDVVAYSAKSGGFVIGRITSVNDEGEKRYYRIKGDNIEGEYYDVMTDQSYIGSFSAEFPFLGALTRFIETTVGQIIFVWIPGAVAAICLIWEIWLTIFGIAKAIDERRDSEAPEDERNRQRRKHINLFGWVGTLGEWLGELFSPREKPVKTYDFPIADSTVAKTVKAKPEVKATPEVEVSPEKTDTKEAIKAHELTFLSAVDTAESKSESVAKDTLLSTVIVTKTVKETVIGTAEATELAEVNVAKAEEAAAQETATEITYPVAEDTLPRTVIVTETVKENVTGTAEATELAEDNVAKAEEAAAQETATEITYPAAEAAITDEAPLEIAAAEIPCPVAEAAITDEAPLEVAPDLDEGIELPDSAADMEEENSDEELAFTYTQGGVKLFSQLRKSFMARLIQSSDELKEYYDEVKRELLSYKGVKGRTSWGCETFKKGKAHLARINVKVKTLCLYLALDFEEFKDTKYFPTDESALAKFAFTPMMVKVKSERGVKYAKELIAILAERYGLERVKKPITDDFKPPYETTIALIERGLIKDLSGTYAKVSAAEADLLMSDSHAEKLIVEETVPMVISDRTRRGIVNIDTLSDSFESGEEIKLEDMKARIRGFDKRMTYVKVLARGTLSKSLTVHADEFSIQAAKMILLTGGKIILTKKKK